MKTSLLNRPYGRAVLYRLAGLLRWLLWGVRYAVIWPLATLAIVVILLFRMDGSTPGQQMAQEIDRVRAMAPPGQFPVRDCPDPVFTVSSPVPEELTENCPLKITGAEAYAADIDQSLSQTGRLLWATLAMLYVAVAVMIGDRPYRHTPRTSVCGMPADRGLTPVDKENDIRRLTENTNGRFFYSGNKDAEKEGDKNEHA